MVIQHFCGNEVIKSNVSINYLWCKYRNSSGEKETEKSGKAMWKLWKASTKFCIWMICRYKIKFISDIEQKIRKLLVNIAVAPFVGVWIEIWVHPQYFHLIRSLPSWECGLKLVTTFLVSISSVSRSLRGSVDWNQLVMVKLQRTTGRSLRGSVDWN